MTTAIQIDSVSKQYRLGVIGARTLSEDIQRRWAKLRGKPDPFRKIGQRVKRKTSTSTSNGDSIWALNDVSFAVKSGEVLGIIGRNGAGKSTLLKILSRVTAPTRGEVRVKGRIASLLEVGTGFHPELTGRENVFLNGAILGMTREEVRRKFDEIVTFADVEQFVDTPVKRYSSGMYVRLAFAVAAHLEPEILVVDEVLAVGDVAFQRKCLGKMGEVSRQGRTILFVSHNMGAITQLCNSALLLDDGRVVDQGASQEVTQRYLTSFLVETDKSQMHFPEQPDVPFQITSVAVTNLKGEVVSSAGLWEGLQIRTTYVVRRRLHGSNLALRVSLGGGSIFESFDTDLAPEVFVNREPGYYRAVIPLPVGLLPAGTYAISISTGLTSVGPLDVHRDVLFFEVMANEDLTHKSYSRGGIVIAKLRWNTESLGRADPEEVFR